jgi:hypothetical protein
LDTVSAVLAGLFGVWSQAGYSPYLRALVEGDHYLRANARAGGARSAAMLAGPSLAGALVEAAGPTTTVLSDAASFLVSFVSLALLGKARQRVETEAGRRLIAEVKEGLRYLWASPLLRSSPGTSASATLARRQGNRVRAGLVRSTRVGKWTHYQRDEQRIAELVAELGRSLCPGTRRPGLASAWRLLAEALLPSQAGA